ncbi:hypothetical protein R50072_21350 [Simiduia litorea]|uniref:hypothetical protein n=1 Tax=Simiduia litorea TaxID=1435348 RepID=UPI0036F2EE99
MYRLWISFSVAVLAAVWLVYKPTLESSQINDVVPSSRSTPKRDAAKLEADNLEQQLLLGHASVQQYLKRQTDKQALHDYFNTSGNDADEAKAIWLQIETLEAEGGVLGFEALHLKMAWLEKNSTDRAAFEAEAKDLLAHYQEKSQASTEKYNPENTPEFKSYKAQELQIIQEVNRLDTIPRGLSREQYLREKLLAARMAAYGEGAED